MHTIFRGMDTFDTSVLYNLDMANVDDDTKIVNDNSSKLINNFSVKLNDEGFELWLLHEVKVTGNHVDKAEIVGTWRVNSTQHLDQMVGHIKGSVLKQLEKQKHPTDL